MTRVFVFTNHKGGVGKSTAATNAAYGIASMLRRSGAANSRVLLIDSDSQAHATLVTKGTKEYGADDITHNVDFRQLVVYCPALDLRPHVPIG